MPAPDDRPHSRTLHRVPFYQTDGMGIVHHANYVHLLELARLKLLDEHDLPYAHYIEQGLHFAVTRIDLRYRRPARFDDQVEIYAWLDWVRGASLGIAYELECTSKTLVTGMSEHALVDNDGRPHRLPADRLKNLRRLAGA